MRTLFLMILAGLVLLPGCGGGGSNSSSGSTLATRLRSIKPGDQWVYNVTGTSLDDNDKPVPATGTLTFSVGSQPFNGSTALALTSAINLTISGQPSNFTLVTFIAQDPATGNISELGDNGGSNGTNRVLAKPQVIFPGMWSTGTSDAVTLDFGSGVTQDYALNVTGMDTVTTPAGTFKVWVANAGTTSGITEDWAPQLGAPVKLVLQNNSTPATSLTAVLQSTTVPH